MFHTHFFKTMVLKTVCGYCWWCPWWQPRSLRRRMLLGKRHQALCFRGTVVPPLCVGPRQAGGQEEGRSPVEWGRYTEANL